MKPRQELAIKVSGYTVFFIGLFAAGYVNGLLKGGDPLLRLGICLGLVVLSGLAAMILVRTLVKRANRSR